MADLDPVARAELVDRLYAAMFPEGLSDEERAWMDHEVEQMRALREAVDAETSAHLEAIMAFGQQTLDQWSTELREVTGLDITLTFNGEPVL